VPPAEQTGKRLSVISMSASAALAAAKIVVGLLANSTSAVADGVESAGDVLASGLVLFGLWVAARPADDNHPYGHGRFEILTGLGLGVLLALTGVAIAFRSWQTAGTPHPPPESFAIWPLVASILIKGTLSVVKFRAGRRIGSSALVADSWNDAVDILSGATALAAVSLAVSDPARFELADHFGGFAVGLIVIFLGVQVIRQTSLHLMDTMPDEFRMGEIRRSATSVPGAIGVEKCFARKTGLRYHVDLHLEVDPDMTVRESHEIATRVREQVKHDLEWVADVLVHVEPHGCL
jgi:cation diffusion facilitator family transporter